MGYLTAKQFSEKWGISERRIIKLCMENRIAGAIKVGRRWNIPEETLKPYDKRAKVSKYVNTKKTIAVINSNADIRNSLNPLLKKEGYEIIEFTGNNFKSEEKYYDGMIFIGSEKYTNSEIVIREFAEKMNCESSILLVNNLKDVKMRLEEKLAIEFEEEIGLRINAINLDITDNENILVNYNDIAQDIVNMIIGYKNTTGNSITTNGGYIEFSRDGKTKPFYTGEFYKVINNYFNSLTKDSYLWCASTMMEDEWTEEPAEMNFRVTNLDAANRGVKMDRIFIFSKSKIKEFRNNKTLQIYMQSNINMLFVDYDEVIKKAPKLIDLVGNGWDGIDKDTLIVDLPAGNKERGYVSINKKEVEKAYNCFQELKKYAKDLREVLKK